MSGSGEYLLRRIAQKQAEIDKLQLLYDTASEAGFCDSRMGTFHFGRIVDPFWYYCVLPAGHEGLHATEALDHGMKWGGEEVA